MLENLRTAIANDNPIGKESLRVLSLASLLLAASMSFFEYTYISLLWDSKVTFAPGFISTFFGLALVSPLYMRSILKWNKSTYSIISFILILLVFSSFIELALGGNEEGELTKFLLGCAFILSWLGLRAVAGVAWILVFAAVMVSAIANDLAMGFSGFIYVCSGTLGLILHSGLNPGEFMKAMKEEYSGTANETANKIKEDMRSVKELI